MYVLVLRVFFVRLKVSEVGEVFNSTELNYSDTYNAYMVKYFFKKIGSIWTIYKGDRV